MVRSEISHRREQERACSAFVARLDAVRLTLMHAVVVTARVLPIAMLAHERPIPFELHVD